MKTLQDAIEYGDINAVESLIKAGADVNVSDEYHGNALQAAAFNGNALKAAAYYGNTEIVKILIEAGADVNVSNEHHENALQAAAYHGNTEIVKILIEAGADVNVSGGYHGNALQAAADNGTTEILKVLIEAGASVNASGGVHGSALHAAVARASDSRKKGNSKEIVEILIKAGADIDALGGRYGSILQAAVAGATHWKHFIKSQLKSKLGVKLQSRARDGSSLLHTAVASGELEILNDLWDAGAKSLINVKNNMGQTPIHLAVMSGNLQVLDKLYFLSPDPKPTFEEIDLDGRTCLHLAVEKEADELVKWLLERGAKADTRDFGDSTAFQQAFQLKIFKILCLLFPKITDNRNLPSASEWRSTFPEDSGQVIMMTNGELATIKMMSNMDLSQYLDERSYDPAYDLVDLIRVFPIKEKTIAENTSEKVLFILENDSVFGDGSESRLQFRWWRQKIEIHPWGGSHKVWGVQPHIVPSVSILRQVSRGECFLECRLGLPVFPVTEWKELPKILKKPFKRLRKSHAVVWIMVKCEPSATEPDAGRPALETKTYFSTLEYAAVPNVPTDLFVPLMQQLQEEWEGVCKATDQHLDFMRTRVLKSDSTLTESLLSDARLLGVLSKLLDDQIATLKTLLESYENKNWTVLHEENKDVIDEKLRAFREERFSLRSKVQKLLGDLTAKSQNLIQLQFNLTSIAEAQRSTSMNRSIKRLSWITFIFLPLMFIGTLFGMNVDILQSNPRWWLYLIFAAGTTTLTLIVWIAFKRNEDLEDRIEEKFRWLAKPKKTRDEEEGYEDDEEESPRGSEEKIPEKKSKWARIWKMKRS